MRRRPIYYVLLAAGLSRRFGGNKLLADICGTPIVRASASVAASAGLPLAVVTGHDRSSVLRALEGVDFVEVMNPAYESGLSSSVRAAIAELREQADALEFAPADMPLIPPSVPRLLAEIREDSGAPLVAPTYRGARGHPVLLGAELYDDALAHLSGDQGLSGLLSSRKELALEVEVDSPGVILDVDSPEDLERVRGIACGGREKR